MPQVTVDCSAMINHFIHSIPKLVFKCKKVVVVEQKAKGTAYLTNSEHTLFVYQTLN